MSLNIADTVGEADKKKFLPVETLSHKALQPCSTLPWIYQFSIVFPFSSQSYVYQHATLALLNTLSALHKVPSGELVSILQNTQP